MTGGFCSCGLNKWAQLHGLSYEPRAVPPQAAPSLSRLVTDVPYRRERRGARRKGVRLTSRAKLVM
jgi:hypothetical protein